MQRRQFLKLGLFGLSALHFSRFAAAAPAPRLPAALRGNPLLDDTALPRFAAVRPEHVKPAMDFLLAHNRRVIAQAAAQKTPAWDTFYQPLAAAANRLDRAWAVVSHLHAVADNDALRQAHAAAQNRLNAFQTWYGQHRGLYRAFSELKKSKEFSNYSPEQQKAVADALLDFKLSGIALPPAQQKIYARISARLSQLSTRFSNNLLDSAAAWEKILPRAEDLAGLPPPALEAAAQSALSKGKSGYRITLDYPSYAAVITYADNRDLRRDIYTAYATRASEQGGHPRKWDNGAVLMDILRLRRRLAKLLGFADYADYALVKRMAESPQQVDDFLRDLLKRSRPQAERELDELRQYAKEHLNINDLQSWDVAYAAEKLKTARYSVDAESLRPYFPAPKVLDGLFETARRLFGVRIAERPNPQTWHKDVRFFEVFDGDNQQIAAFYLDLYAREGKRAGAWMNGLADRCRLPESGLQRPLAVLVLNARPPADNQPALLSHDDVTTLFHEFGHGLHHMLTAADVAAVSGINGVPWDAVEFPSQMLENWTWDKTALKLISGHFQSGEPLPDELLAKVLAAKNFQAARAIVRQLQFALTDLRLHRENPSAPDFALRVSREVAAETALPPDPDFVRRANAFSHIFAGGYAAGYYGYLWSEVLAADAFSRFAAEGVFNRATGQAFLNDFLAQGGTRAPMAMFEAFMGRKPKIDALLAQRGIGG